MAANVEFSSASPASGNGELSETTDFPLINSLSPLSSLNELEVDTPASYGSAVEKTVPRSAPQDGAPPLPRTSGNTYVQDQRKSLRQMESQLSQPAIANTTAAAKPPVARHHRKQPGWLSTPAVDETSAVKIYAISGAAFHVTCLHKTGDQVFSTSLHEIDSLISQKQDEAAELAALHDTVRLSKVSLAGKAAAISQFISQLETEPPTPEEYSEWNHVFSKAESNILPPHRTYDHKIELEGDGEKALKYSPLYKMSTEELEAVKNYIVDNLEKGFIEPSQSPFAAPILFVRKSDGSLRLCIDFRALNALTRKDRHPLPLIDETLARISRAKIFTKLDIRQAFHRIRMDPSSEEYTTFRTRYGAYKCKVPLWSHQWTCDVPTLHERRSLRLT